MYLLPWMLYHYSGGPSFLFSVLSAVVAAWLTVDATAPASVKYPATDTRAAGSATGAATIVPAIAATMSPHLRSFLKNGGVGAMILC